MPDRLDRPFLDPLFDRLFPRLASGVEWGLGRMRSALAELGDPHLQVPAVHIGGTNGKGSVTALMSSVLRARGLRVGMYTSPHLCSLAERFQVDGAPAPEARLLEVAGEIRPTVESHDLTFFEAATLLAFQLFAREEVDVQVLEVGLGGRLDATNVVTPLVSVLTNVAMDHADFLGNTLTAIAREKAGILKPGVPAVTAETGDEALGVFRREADRRGVALHEVDPARVVEGLEVARDHTAFSVDSEAWGRLDVRIPLVGAHQAANAALAVRALALLPEPLRPTRSALLDGLARVVWPGRDQIRRQGGVWWILDVAHNTAGVGSLTRVLDRLDLPRPRVALVGVLGDKEWDAMLPPLLSRVDHAVLTQPPSAPESRRWDPREAMAQVRRSAGEAVIPPLEVLEDFPAALERARERALEGAGGGTVVVTGSCHTVGDALRILHVDPFGSDGRDGDPGTACAPAAD